jgi:hypothetical protein
MLDCLLLSEEKGVLVQNIITATADFERWLGERTTLQSPEMKFKHRQMADENQGFSFFRGTYYRWCQHWQNVEASLRTAPIVLSVGDLHIENFGTWRDVESRLVWGINDFDEADWLPYLHDLVRLAASVWFARHTFGLAVKLGEACHCILKGYRLGLEQGGKPFVLEEEHANLRSLALNADRDPAKFWGKLTKLLADPEIQPPESAKRALSRLFPEPSIEPQFRVRPNVGMGSLGKPRYLALLNWKGGWIAREAKSATPPATAWLLGREAVVENLPSLLNKQSVRCCDPFFDAESDWITRRLAPRCSRIDLAQLVHAREVESLLEAMGTETANIHLADRSLAGIVLGDLERRATGWLEDTAHDLAKKIEADWVEWRELRRSK